MYYDHKIGIDKSIIQYLLNTTTYSLQQIANLSNSSIQHVNSIYFHAYLPSKSNVDLNLLKLFSILIDMKKKGQWHPINYHHKEWELANGIN